MAPAAGGLALETGLNLARLAQAGGQIAAGPQRVGVIGAEHSVVVLKQSLEPDNCFLYPTCPGQPDSQFAPGAQRVGVIGAEHPAAAPEAQRFGASWRSLPY